MAVMDFLVIVAAVILSRLPALYFPVSLLSTTPGCSLVIAFSWFSKDTSAWLTVAFTFDRFIAICCPHLKVRYCTEKIATVVIGTVCVLYCVKNVPFFFTYEPAYVLDNIPWYCSIKDVYYTSLAWKIYDWLLYMVNPCVPFVLILLLNVFTVRHILAASGARKRLRAQSHGDKQNDPEMESRRKSIIILFAISGSFLLLRFTNVVNFVMVQFLIKNYANNSNSTNPMFILQESGYMMELLSSCTNTCIYAGTQAKFREQLKNLVKCPFKAICNRFKR
ncbi:probable G-protein coupled receptor 139 [Amblyraja radiata]|uniref:probable G-protein coupled receptor 139 n=1 Tax=Amblyraja radiata TaxID=386614 RepID=UPI0014036208|nr:probable G-protein coupled receptor 139 [Amblyraja radiata]